MAAGKKQVGLVIHYPCKVWCLFHERTEYCFSFFKFTYQLFLKGQVRDTGNNRKWDTAVITEQGL